MQQLIAKIGKGQRGAKDLTWDEAQRAMQFLIEDRASPVQTGAFLMAMRIKMETVSELAAFTLAARQYAAPLPIKQIDRLVDLPLYGEKHETGYGILAASIVASAAGASILLHGVENSAIPVDIQDVVVNLGIPADLSAEQATRTLEEHGWAYLDLGAYHPAVARHLGLRQELGVQNLFHQVARMLNPARAGSQVIGIAHPPYLEKMIEALDMAGSRHALVFQGMEGFPELSIVNPTSLRELRRKQIFPVNLKPKDVGLPSAPFQGMAAHKPTAEAPGGTQEAAFITQLLNNLKQGSQTNWVILNAALLLYASGMAPSVKAGVPMATHTIASGKAAAKLRELGSLSPSPSRSPSSHTPVPA